MTFRQFQYLLMEANPEKRIQFLTNTYSKKLKDLIMSYYDKYGKSYPHVYPDQKGNETSDDIVPKLIRYIVLNVDPQSGTYSEWIIKSLLNGTNVYYTLDRLGRLAEDWYKVKDDLTIYHQYKRLLKTKPNLEKFTDINKVRGFTSLMGIVDSLTDDIDKEEAKNEIKLREKEVVKLYDSPRFLILIPKTQEASCAYGRGTRWCTAATGSYNAFNSYNKQGPLYIIIDKNKDEKFQFHFQSEQFMDKDDNSVSFEDFATDYYKEIIPSLSELAIENDAIHIAILFDPDLLDKLIEEDDIEQLEKLAYDPKSLILILEKEPSLMNELLKSRYTALIYKKDNNSVEMKTTWELQDLADIFIKDDRRGGVKGHAARILAGDDYDEFSNHSRYVDFDTLISFLDESYVEKFTNYVIDYYSLYDKEEEGDIERPSSFSELEGFLYEYDSDGNVLSALRNVYDSMAEDYINSEKYEITVDAITNSLPGKKTFNDAGHLILTGISLSKFISMLHDCMYFDLYFNVNANEILKIYAKYLDYNDELESPDYDNIYVDINNLNEDTVSYFREMLEDQIDLSI